MRRGWAPSGLSEQVCLRYNLGALQEWRIFETEAEKYKASAEVEALLLPA